MELIITATSLRNDYCSCGFEKVASAADEAMNEILREDFMLSDFDKLEASRFLDLSEVDEYQVAA